MKKIMYASIALGLCVGAQAHGMLRRRLAPNVVPPTARAYEHRVENVVMPEVPTQAFKKAAQGAAAKVGSVYQGFTAKARGAQAAAAAQREALRQGFAASRARMGAAMRGVKMPILAVGGGALIGGAGVAVYSQPDIDALDGRVAAISQMLPVLGDAKQESIWRSMFDAPYSQLLNALSRESLELEYSSAVSDNLTMEDEDFRKIQAKELQGAVHTTWTDLLGVVDSTVRKAHDRRIMAALDRQNEAVKVHEQQQEAERARLRDLSHMERYELIDELRNLKPNLLLKQRERQQEERVSNAYFPVVRQKMVNTIRL